MRVFDKSTITRKTPRMLERSTVKRVTTYANGVECGTGGTSGTLAFAGSGAAPALDERVARAAAAVLADRLSAARLVCAVPVAPAAQADALAARLLARVVAAHVVVGGHAVH